MCLCGYLVYFICYYFWLSGYVYNLIHTVMSDTSLFGQGLLFLGRDLCMFVYVFQEAVVLLFRNSNSCCVIMLVWFGAALDCNLQINKYPFLSNECDIMVRSDIPFTSLALMV